MGNVVRCFRGVLIDSSTDGGVRTVTFANGTVVRENIITVDDEHKRVVYSAIGQLFVHHSASMQLFDEGEGRCRFVWISDFLPSELAAMISPLADQGCRVLKENLERELHGSRTTASRQIA